MKVLLFSFVLGLLVASQGEAQTDASQLTGRWKSHYTAADNIEKITEGGPFHTFLRYMKFDEENGTALFQFYFKSGRSPGGVNGHPLLYTCLENPTDRDAWWATVQGVPKNWTGLSNGGHTQIQVPSMECPLYRRPFPRNMEDGECRGDHTTGTKDGDVYSFQYAGHTEFQVVRVENNALLADVINVDEHGKETQLVQLFGIGDDVGPKCKEEFYNTVREKGIPEENILNFIDQDDCPEEWGKK